MKTETTAPAPQPKPVPYDAPHTGALARYPLSLRQSARAVYGVSAGTAD